MAGAVQVVEYALSTASSAVFLGDGIVIVAENSNLNDDLSTNTNEYMCESQRTPFGTGMLPPARAISRGQPLAGLVPEGNLIVLENVTELDVPPVTPPAVTLRVVPEKEPETCGGFGGIVPAS